MLERITLESDEGRGPIDLRAAYRLELRRGASTHRLVLAADQLEALGTTADDVDRVSTSRSGRTDTVRHYQAPRRRRPDRRRPLRRDGVQIVGRPDGSPSTRAG